MKLLSCFIFAVASAGFLNADHKITITGNDTMQFDVKEFSVKAGAKVELTFKNIGKLPKLAMGHNLVILKEGVSPLKFGKLLGPGESEKLTFTAPKQEGLYQFLCSFPGHYAIMRGVMVVE